jgi:hypothetical protein
MESSQYQVVQFEVIKGSNGYCIAAFNELNGGFSRLSLEEYPRFEEACTALFQGDWTPFPFVLNFQPEQWPVVRGGQTLQDDAENMSRLHARA